MPELNDRAAGGSIKQRKSVFLPTSRGSESSLKTVMEKPGRLRFLKYPCQSYAVSSECVFYLSRVIESEDEAHSLPPFLPPCSSISSISVPPLLSRSLEVYLYLVHHVWA